MTKCFDCCLDPCKCERGPVTAEMIIDGFLHLGEMFDNPKNPAVVIILNGRHYTAGYIMRRLVDEIRSLE